MESGFCKSVGLVLGLFVFTPDLMRAEEPRAFEQKCTSTEASSSQSGANFDTTVFDVENKCDVSIRCDLNIAIYSAFGIKQGHKIVVIEPHAHGSLVLKTKSSGSLTERDHRCKPIETGNASAKKPEDKTTEN